MSLMPLKEYLNNVVRVITIDGRTYQGVLTAIDNQTNLVLTSTEERSIQPAESDEENKLEPMGVFIIRGDLVLMCGLVDEEMDASIDWMKVKGGPIESTKHT
ncbi:Sm-like ribonucleo protein [Venturia nashicola]|uniref:LSM2-LSM8 complex subunit LSM8 n=1 Tax=Venturia nashicola TaxID=86259 RepID=A0A4Z1PDL5_9PEZI|nr:Sm-like ribonucleo protein [Venturia nashicola]TLD39368.1 Sm-like ribonucleo protein [Venturia nashicola]